MELKEILKKEIDKFGTFNVYDIVKINNDKSLMRDRILREYNKELSAQEIYDCFMKYFYDEEEIKIGARNRCRLE